MTDENISDVQEQTPTKDTDGQVQEQPSEDLPKNQDDSQESALVKAQAEAQKNMEGWQRTLAEFQNYKRRTEREQQDLRHRASLDALTKMLPIIDDFERALASIPETIEGDPWMNGVSLILGKFNKLLDEHDVEAVDPVGQPFDPNHHQAITMDESDEYESGYVIETLQKGYLSGNTLLRPALVRVAN